MSVGQVASHRDALETANAIIFARPTYVGSAPGQFKLFMDTWSQRAFMHGKWKDKLATGFSNGASRSGEKLNTLQQVWIFAVQHGMHWIKLGLPPGHNSSTSTQDTLNRHGYFIGAAAQSDADASAQDGTTPADLNTYAHRGARVALAPAC